MKVKVIKHFYHMQVSNLDINEEFLAALNSRLKTSISMEKGGEPHEVNEEIVIAALRYESLRDKYSFLKEYCDFNIPFRTFDMQYDTAIQKVLTNILNEVEHQDETIVECPNILVIPQEN